MPAPRKAAKLDRDNLYEYAVRILAARTYSSEKLRAKLRLKAADHSDVDYAISRLKEVGYLDDARFAESFARYRVEGAGFGQRRVMSDLRAQRIAPKTAEKAVAKVLEGTTESELIDAFIARRLPNEPLQDQRALVRAYNRLLRAGFSSSGSLAALKRRSSAAELLDSEPEDEPESL